MILYNQHFDLPDEYIKQKISEYLQEDIPAKDFTTLGTIPPQTNVTAYIEAEGDTVFAGEKIIPHFFDEAGFDVSVLSKDGDKLNKGDIAAKISGNAGVILERERTLLNLLQRLCGIAYQARIYADKAQGKIKILDTRKTTPGLRLFEKYAVAVGGGTNHRLNLSDGILIKDNHVKAAGGVSAALNKIKTLELNLPVELEVDNFDQIREALAIGVDGFLLDNMSPEIAKKAVEIIRNDGNGKSIFIECSGGITLDSLEGYLNIGIDAVSVGALTHSVISAPIHMEFE